MNLRFLITAIKPMIPELKDKLDPAIQEMLAKVPLEQGEEKALYMLHYSQVDQKAYIATALLDHQDRIVRIATQEYATEFLMTILSKI